MEETPEKRPFKRPLKYQTVAQLQEAVDEYFTFCDNKTKEIHSEKLGDMIVPDPEPYTMSGLACALGMSRMALLNYSKRDEYSEVIEKAKSRIEADIERRMNNKDTFTPGLIFNAKNNFGWRDRHDITSDDKPLIPLFDYTQAKK